MLSCFAAGSSVRAADGLLELALPPTAPNAALHYQRGLLFLSAVDPAKRELLAPPIWELIGDMPKEGRLDAINDLLFASRHAIRSALIGAEQRHADFGIDPAQYAVANLIPHTYPMVDLHKIVLLYGMQLESAGDWKEAARVYTKALRMGRHMTHQPTLLEALTGVEMLEGAYYTFSMWAVRCPQQSLLEQASLMLNVLAKEMLDPAAVLSHEARILKLQLAKLRQAFPDGPWAEMVLEALDAAIPHASDREMREAALAAAADRGLPAEILRDKQAFDRHVAELESLHLAMARRTAAALTFSGMASVERGQAVYDSFAAKLRAIGDPHVVNPGQIAARFATHDAELMLAKIVVALAAMNNDQGFPKQLDNLAGQFGGKVPRSPYNGSPLRYDLLENGHGFSLAVPEVKVGNIDLPRIGFKFAPGEGCR